MSSSFGSMERLTTETARGYDLSKAGRRGMERSGICPLSGFPTGRTIVLTKQVLTIVVKLQPTPEQVSKLETTLSAFAAACNYVNDHTEPKITNKIALQALTYQTIKAEFDLVANMAVRACARVGMNRKAAKLKGKPVQKFAPTSMDCDKDLFTFREKEWEVSLATVQGRERVKLNVGNYPRGKLKGCKPTSAQLCKHRAAIFFYEKDVGNDKVSDGE